MTNNQPLITAVIPTFKRPSLLKFAITSVQNQTFKNLQILVLDNASDDETKELVTSLSEKDPRIIYHRHEKNIGSFANFKFGYNLVTTPFFSFLSDDDFIFPDFYEQAYQLLLKYPDAAFSAGQTMYIRVDGTISGVSLLSRGDEEYYDAENSVFECSKGDLPTWTSMLFRKKSCDFFGGINDHCIMDEEFVINTYLHHSFVLFKKPCAFFILATKMRELSLTKEALLRRSVLISSINKSPFLSDAKKVCASRFLLNISQEAVYTQFFNFIAKRNFQAARSILEEPLVKSNRPKSYLWQTILFCTEKSPLLTSMFYLIFTRIKKLRLKKTHNKYCHDCEKHINYCKDLYFKNYSQDWLKTLASKD